MSRQVAFGLRSKYDFRWDVLDVIVHGKSSIDATTGFQIQNLSDADRFIESYGYHLDNPIENAEVLGNFREALNFIRKYFLQPENPNGLKLEIPRKILELNDIRDLFLMASLQYPAQQADTQGHLLRSWACALLKVMHTIAHIDKDLRTPYFADIQQQIFDRFYKVIHRDTMGSLYLGEKEDDPLRVDLVSFETKPKKSRESIILKLLHKPENVAEDIFDRVGLRFVTRTPVDSLRVIKYLKDKMIVMPPNIKPSRSRNTLINTEMFQSKLRGLLAQAERGEIDEAGLNAELNQCVIQASDNTENPHSSAFYRAIQFTCRQLIKLQNPLYNDLRELKQIAKATAQSESEQDPRSDTRLSAMLARLDRIDLKYVQREIRFFYPY